MNRPLESDSNESRWGNAMLPGSAANSSHRAGIDITDRRTLVFVPFTSAIAKPRSTLISGR
jgi:hypothetical protein